MQIGEIRQLLEQADKDRENALYWSERAHHWSERAHPTTATHFRSRAESAVMHATIETLLLVLSRLEEAESE